MALRHVVLFRFRAAATDDQVQAMAAGLDRMPEATGTTLAFTHGRDAAVNEGAYDYAVVADFATVDDYRAYRDHPDHRALVSDLQGTIVAERAYVQFELPTP
jgi:hypothetical protein